VSRPPPPRPRVSRPAPSGYAGFVTRAVALAIDAVAIDVIAVLTGGAVNLIASLFGHHGTINLLEALFGAAAWLVWSALYFVTFWTLTGQTPGDRLLGIRVQSVAGGRIGLRQAFRRVVGMALALLPLGAGFLPVLTDERRRGLHDRIAGTVVRWDDDEALEPIPPEPAPVTAPEPAAVPDPTAGRSVPII
jgi:uncharacterized RDD family membrane protein YckC